MAVRTISDLERGVARRPRWETARLLAVALGLGGPELDVFLRRVRGVRRAACRRGGPLSRSA